MRWPCDRDLAGRPTWLARSSPSLARSSTLGPPIKAAVMAPSGWSFNFPFVGDELDELEDDDDEMAAADLDPGAEHE